MRALKRTSTLESTDKVLEEFKENYKLPKMMALEWNEDMQNRTGHSFLLNRPKINEEHSANMSEFFLSPLYTKTP